MKNGIIINGTAYELVETDSFLFPDDVCENCALKTRCEKMEECPCDVFKTKHWGYFVKVEENK